MKQQWRQQQRRLSPQQRLFHPAVTATVVSPCRDDSRLARCMQISLKPWRLKRYWHDNLTIASSTPTVAHTTTTAVLSSHRVSPSTAAVAVALQ